MSIFNLFQNSHKKKGLAHLKNLVQVAMADGTLDKKEYEFLLSVAEKYGIEHGEMLKLKSTARKNMGNLNQETGSSKFEQIYDLIKMMVIDGKISPYEIQMCKVFARKMGFPLQKIDELIDSIYQNIASGYSVEETLQRVSFLIND